MRGADIMADRILEICARKGFTVRALAARSGIPEGTLYMVTRRNSELSCRNVRKLCKAMHVSADWLLGLEG